MASVKPDDGVFVSVITGNSPQKLRRFEDSGLIPEHKEMMVIHQPTCSMIQVEGCLDCNCNPRIMVDGRLIEEGRA